ncbi:MAG: hypothetical protein IKQ91_04635 [Oscillospiraceae bacterium]|nr:hypothetical protein [Oscillospiraceae bacterium]
MRRFSKEEKMLRQIQSWERKHLRTHTKVNYALTVDLLKNDGMDSDFRKYIITKEYTFVSDTSRTFSLGVFGETVKGWLTEACRKIEIFHERQALRGKLDKVQREDSLYYEMDTVFYGLMAQFLHAITFFQYDRITNPVYREYGSAQIQRILERCEKLLEYYGSYISLQGATAFAEPYDEISSIQIAVETMQETLRDSQFPSAMQGGL